MKALVGVERGTRSARDMGPQMQPGGQNSGFCLSATLLRIVAVQSLSRVRLSVTPWTAARQASLSPTVSQSLLKLESYDFTIQQAGSPEVPMGTDEATQPKPLLSLLEDGAGKTEASQTTAA